MRDSGFAIRYVSESRYDDWPITDATNPESQIPNHSSRITLFDRREHDFDRGIRAHEPRADGGARREVFRENLPVSGVHVLELRHVRQVDDRVDHVRPVEAGGLE